MREQMDHFMSKGYPIFSVSVLILCLTCFSGVDAKADQIVLPSSLPDCPVQRVTGAILSSDDIIWVIGEQSGIYAFDLKAHGNNKWVPMCGSKDVDSSTNFYSIVEDRQGRIWVGTDNEGIMVYNGRSWESYTVDNTLLSNRIYNLMVSSVTGEVGIACSGGVTIYNPNDQSWKDFTRGNGLIEDQVKSLTFSDDGFVWFGYSCGGVTRGNSKYPVNLWQHIQAPWNWDDKGFVRHPLTPTGKGLPSNLCNAIISSSDTVWVATCAGIAYSSTKGKELEWRYVRGFDYLEKNKGLYNPGNSIKWETKKMGNLLPQDYISTLAPAKHGLWIGTRDQGICRWSPQRGIIEKLELPSQHKGFEITTLVNFPDGSIGYGTNGRGFGIIKNGSGKWTGRNLTRAISKHPEKPPIPEERQIMSLLAQGKSSSITQSDGIYVGEDWMTKGDWPGRYGNVYALLCSSDGEGLDGRYTTQFVFGKHKKYLTEDMYVILQDYEIDGFIGPHHTAQESYMPIVNDDDSESRSALFTPSDFTRKEAVWDDMGENYHDTWDGPDLWVKIILPEGVHELDLYFYNTVDNIADSFKKDFYIEMRKEFSKPNKSLPSKENSGQYIEGLYSLPVLARARVLQFSGSGVYKKFLSSGQGTYWFRISRNSSPKATLNGIFVSKFFSPLKINPELIKKADVYFNKMLPLPPPLKSETIGNHSVFLKLWNYVSEKEVLSPSIQSNVRRALTYQYRRLNESGASRDLKEKLAWDLDILNKNDYLEFDRIISNMKGNDKNTENDAADDASPLSQECNIKNQ